MEIHDRAWEGFRILVLGKTSLLPMQIEQSIASAHPDIEVQLSSFESYDQAFKFCKQEGNVGFFLITEDAADVPFNSAFKELAVHYEKNGFPAFGAILYHGEPNAFSERLVSKTPQLLEYLPTSVLLNPNQVDMTMRQLWQSYVLSFEQKILPKPLQDSLNALAEDRLGVESFHFISRLTNNLSSELNLSWLENVALKWAYVLEAVEESAPAVLRPSPHLRSLLQLCKGPSIGNITSDNLGSQIPLSKKVFALAKELDLARTQGKLGKILDGAASLAKPGAPKLLRHLQKHKNTILTFELDAKNIKRERLA
jgi:hypothetical protein